MLAKPFKMASKNAQNALKTRFSGFPTTQTSFWVDFREVDFFTQVTPFSIFRCDTWNTSNFAIFRRKSGLFTLKTVKTELQNVFFVIPDPKNNKVALSEFKSLSTSFYCEKSCFFDFFEGKFTKSTEGAGRDQLFGQCYHIAFESSAQTTSSR